VSESEFLSPQECLDECDRLGVTLSYNPDGPVTMGGKFPLIAVSGDCPPELTESIHYNQDSLHKIVNWEPGSPPGNLVRHPRQD
jgi:hypothetical protein